MPELPEVETIKLGLAKKVFRKKIKSIWIEPSFKKKISPSAGKFVRFLKGKRFTSVKRRAKILIFGLDCDYKILVHLKMTGQLVYYPKKGKELAGDHPIKGRENQPDRFSRVIFQFTDQSQLYYNDVRKFGYIKLIKNQDIEKEFAKFGPEPFDKEFSQTYFYDILKKNKNKKIKSILLEQNLIAGLGNIYTDEVCFYAGVRPERFAGSLSRGEKMKLFLFIKKVLTKAIKYQGASVNTYIGSNGAQGKYQKVLKVYGRYGELCKNCSEKIKKIKISGRASSYCPKCQT